jgi:hypothetical protein
LAAPQRHVVLSETGEVSAGRPNVARGGSIDAGDKIEQSRLAAAGFAENGEEFPRSNAQRDTTQRLKLLAVPLPEGFRGALEPDDVHIVHGGFGVHLKAASTRYPPC